MPSSYSSEKSRETKYSHFIQAGLPITFVIIMLLDSFVFQISVWLNEIVPFIVRLILCAVVFVIAMIFVKLSHDALFHHNAPPNTLITDGILSHVRNPMYLGVLLIYVAFLFLSISLISIVFFIFVVIIYNKMVNYEETVLEELFGEDWLAYKNRVPKWIPR